MDAGGSTGSFAFDCPSVEVDPGEAPTETAPPPTATATEPAPVTPTPTDEPAPTDTPETGDEPTIYLPATLKNAESDAG